MYEYMYIHSFWNDEGPKCYLIFCSSYKMTIHDLHQYQISTENWIAWYTIYNNVQWMAMTDIPFVVKRSFTQRPSTITNTVPTTGWVWNSRHLVVFQKLWGNVINAKYVYAKRENLHWIFRTPFIHSQRKPWLLSGEQLGAAITAT